MKTSRKSGGKIMFCGNGGSATDAQHLSGNSANVVKALEAAREIGVVTVALSGQGGGRIAEIADHLIRVPWVRTNSIQEMHIMIGHMPCGFVEEELC